MDSTEDFFTKWSEHFHKNRRGVMRYPVEHDMDLFALFVIDEMPTTVILFTFVRVCFASTNNFPQTIDKILHDNFDDDAAHLWLADTYENLPGFQGWQVLDGTRPPLDPSWKSPFCGKSLAEVTAWVRGIPKPPKAINKRYFAVVQKDLYEQHGRILICKVIKGESQPQAMAREVHRLAVWVKGYPRDEWVPDWNSDKGINYHEFNHDIPLDAHGLAELIKSKKGPIPTV